MKKMPYNDVISMHNDGPNRKFAEFIFGAVAGLKRATIKKHLFVFIFY